MNYLGPARGTCFVCGGQVPEFYHLMWCDDCIAELQASGESMDAFIARKQQERKDMEYNAAQRKMIEEEAKDKTIESLEWDEAGYWVMTFTDGTEISFKFMSELYPKAESGEETGPLYAGRHRKTEDGEGE